MQKHNPKTHTPPRSLSSFLGEVNEKIRYLGQVAEEIDTQLKMVDAQMRAVELPPRWPGAYLAGAPAGLQLGIHHTTLNQGWHDRWLGEVELRKEHSVLLPSLQRLYAETLAQVEVLLARELQEPPAKQLDERPAEERYAVRDGGDEDPGDAVGWSPSKSSF